MCVGRKNKKGEYYCDITKLPITVFNAFGSYCEKLCGYEAQIFATSRTAQWMDDMGPIFDRLKDKD